MSKPTDTLSQLLDMARALGADAADAVLFETTDVSAARRMGKPEGLERSESRAVGLRAFSGARQAIVSTTDMHKDALKELAERAIAMAKAAPPDPDSTLAAESLYSQSTPELDLFDEAEPDNDWLSEQCRLAEDAARSQPGITNSEGAEAHYGTNSISLAVADKSSLRFARSYRSSHFSLSVSVLAGSGTGMERDYDFSSSRHRKDLADAETVGKGAARRALKRLNPRKVSSCKAPVVFDPRVSRSLVGVLAGAISGNAVSRGASFLKDALNTPVFSSAVTIIDDPHIRRGLGSKPFDAEGVRNEKRAIVKDGMLTTWLLDMRTANKLNMQTTGHASRGVASPPSPSATNLYMQKGHIPVKKLIGDVKNGFYVTETFGMGVNTVTGDYSQGAAGFWIEQGELAYPVSEITIAGNLRDMFKSVTPADDLVFHYATNAPTLRVEGMTVAGA